jgi:presenilin-like A22 family membrane protease
MKHNVKITILLLLMFVATQLIGLYAINSDIFNRTVQINGVTEVVTNPILSAIRPPEVQQQSDFTGYLISLIIAFVIAIVILFLLTKFKIGLILKGWFFVVVTIALFITFNSFFPNYINSAYFFVFSILFSLTLSFIKIFKRNFIIHNLTELLIYPGIATLLVSILNFWSMLILLGIISVYDIWAVWHSGVMQKMAKYQINELKIFSGFFVPYVSKKMRKQLQKLRKNKKLKDKKVKVNLAILGGGDVVFPLITAGVVLMADKISLPFTSILILTGGILPALFVVAGATLGLGLLLSFSEKKKFYPAMPFITAGILFGLILSAIIF